MKHLGIINTPTWDLQVDLHGSRDMAEWSLEAIYANIRLPKSDKDKLEIQKHY